MASSPSPLSSPLTGAGGLNADSSEQEREEELNYSTENPNRVVSEDEDDDEEDVAYFMDPDNPLLRRVQERLKAQLSAQLDDTEEALRAKKKELAKVKGSRETVGVELYGLQQQLANAQLECEKSQDAHIGIKEERLSIENQAQKSRVDAQSTRRNHDSIADQLNKLRHVADALEGQLKQVERYQVEMNSQVALAKRGAKKKKSDLIALQEEKSKQDFLLDDLEENCRRVRDDIALLKAKKKAQETDTKKIAEALREANAEIEALTFDKRQISSQWQSSVVALGHRDEAKAAMQEAIKGRAAHLKSRKNEIDGTRQLIANEQQNHEQLLMRKSRLDKQIFTTQENINDLQSQQTESQAHYATLIKSLKITETDLQKETSRTSLIQSDFLAARRNLEKDTRTLKDLEERWVSAISEEAASDNAVEIVKRQLTEIAKKNKKISLELSNCENTVVRERLESMAVRKQIEDKMKHNTDSQKALDMKNEKVTQLDKTIKSNIIHINRQTDKLQQTGHRIAAIEKRILDGFLDTKEAITADLRQKSAAKSAENKDMQNRWLEGQQKIVALTTEIERTEHELNTAKGTMAVLQQKRNHIEFQIDSEETQLANTTKQIDAIHLDLQRLSHLLNRQVESGRALSSTASITETEYSNILREQELQSLQLSASLENIQESTEKLTKEVLESEKIIQVWEKRIQLARETKAALKPDEGEDEILIMKAEIHRMELRLSQLKRSQEQLIQEMEQAIDRRGTITEKAKLSKKSSKNSGKHGTEASRGNTQRHNIQLKKKIASLLQNVESMQNSIEYIGGTRSDLEQNISDSVKKRNELEKFVLEAKDRYHSLSKQLEKSLLDTVGKQKLYRHIQNKIKPKFSTLDATSKAIANENEQKEKIKTLALQIADHHSQLAPHFQRVLRNNTSVLNVTDKHQAIESFLLKDKAQFPIESTYSQNESDIKSYRNYKNMFQNLIYKVMNNKY